MYTLNISYVIIPRIAKLFNNYSGPKPRVPSSLSLFETLLAP